MPQLRPISPIRYAVEPSGDLSTRIAPPYDVLDEQPKRRLLERDPCNIVAVDLPVTPPKTVGPHEAYERAGRTFRQWLREGVLVRDDQPAVIAYEQAFQLHGRRRCRRGFFAALALEPFGRRGGGIHRHEHTIASGAEDRLKLMRATAAQLSPVFGVYDDEPGDVTAMIEPWFERREPSFHAKTDADGVEHRCWMIEDRAAIARLREAMAGRDVLIADGHHRYTTALNYRRERPDASAASSCLFVLVAAQDPGLEVLPTHRVVCGMDGFSMPKLMEMLQADARFDVRETHHRGDGTPHLPDELPRAGHHAVGLYDPARDRTYVLATTDPDPLAEPMPQRPAVWRRLDVAIVHELLVERLLRPSFGGAAIHYTYPHELTDLIVQSHQEPGRLGIIMQPTPLRQVREAALAGEVMPPKSTFFYPKLATGLVINPLDH